MDANNDQEPQTRPLAVTAIEYTRSSADEQAAVQALLNFQFAHSGSYVEFVTDSRDGGAKNHNFTRNLVVIRFKEHALPVPPKIRSGYWERVYNRADSANKVHGTRRIADQKSRKTYREALLKLAEDLCSAGQETTEADKAEKRRVLRETRGVLDEEFVAFMAQEMIEIDVAAWTYRDLKDQV